MKIIKNKIIETEGSKIVTESSIYGSKNASVGSSARSYYETQMKGFEEGVKFAENKLEVIMIEFAIWLRTECEIATDPWNCPIDYRYNAIKYNERELLELFLKSKE